MLGFSLKFCFGVSTLSKGEAGYRSKAIEGNFIYFLVGFSENTPGGAPSKFVGLLFLPKCIYPEFSLVLSSASLMSSLFREPLAVNSVDFLNILFFIIK